MRNEYQHIPGFDNWYDKADDNVEAKFSYDFWVKNARNNIIHVKENLQPQMRRQVTIGLRLQSNKDGGTDAYRDDPPADDRLRFAEEFDEIEGGNAIVDRCKDYLDALTQMVEDWENKLKSP